MIARTAGLVLAMAALWGLACWPAHHLAGPIGVVGSGVAAALCTVPAAVTLAAGRWAMTRGTWLLNSVLLGGILIRMMSVLMVGGAVYLAVPGFRRNDWSFLFWLVGFYLISLTLEMVLLLTGRPSHP